MGFPIVYRKIQSNNYQKLKYALPELRKSKGRIIAATSGAGQAPLFVGWGFYGMSKAAISFMVKQLSLEEPEVTVIGISPGLCDTKMVGGLLNGSCKSLLSQYTNSPQYWRGKRKY